MRITRDMMFLEIVKVVEKRSVCLRRKVGAVICIDNRPVALGYNGPPSGIDYCCTPGDSVCKGSIHAEMNAIAFAAKNGIALKGATMYISASPCINCAKIILNSGISEVVYRDHYRDPSGAEFLSQFIVVRQEEIE